MLILLLIVRSAWFLLRDSLHILLEGAPADIDTVALAKELVADINEVVSVDHVHVWSITSGKTAATLEVQLTPEADPRAVTKAIKRELRERFGIAHSTVEIVWDESDGCALEATGRNKE